MYPRNLALESIVDVPNITELSEPNNVNDGVIQNWPRRYHGIFDIVFNGFRLSMWIFKFKDKYDIGCVIVYFTDSKYVLYSNEQH